jgi:hypothetical protein
MTPAHGSAARSRVCRCTRCCAYREGTSRAEIRKLPERYWPVRPLEMCRLGRLKDHFSAETVDRWRSVGLSDVEADHVATYFHENPMDIWTGWLLAGLDYEMPAETEKTEEST